MTAQNLAQGRKRVKLTQVEAAAKLGVSQPYLSLLEKGERIAPPNLARRAVKLYRLPATKLPVTIAVTPRPSVGPDRMAKQLAALGYPGFAYMRGGRRRNPAEVLFCALAQNNLEPRLIEALPWVLSQYADLDWNWLVGAVKQHDLQNRLGFLITLAVQVAESRNADASDVQLLKRYENELKQSLLAKEDTLCHESLSSAERTWLRKERSEEAGQWNLLTDLKVEHAHA
jgi:transcriptional regulator with XRE-family HTH domain